MGRTSQITRLNSAWKTGNLEFKNINIRTPVTNASFDGEYICLTTEDNSCFILNSDLDECTSFKIDGEFEVSRNVFTKSRGLVLAGGDSEIIITTFDGWERKPPIKAVGSLTGLIEALSTRDGLILAGSAYGEVEGWSYNGVKLYQIQLPKVTDNCVRSISVGPNNFVVGCDDAVYEYEIPTRPPLSTPATPHMNKCIPKDGVQWASYDIEGNDARRRLVLSKPETVLDTYRPVLPRDKSRLRTYLLSLYGPSKEIVIHNFKNFKYICGYQVDEEFFDNIQFMWSTHTRLFLIDYKDAIYMMDFGRELAGSQGAQLDGSFETPECFGFDIRSQR